MTADIYRTSKPWIYTIGVAVGAVGCRAEVPVPEPVAIVERSAADAAASSVASAPSPAPLEPHRDLWFRDGPGRRALLARERGDHDEAVALLDQLLSQPDLDERSRVGAVVLRGLEHRDRDEFVEAAEAFGVARASSDLEPIRLRVTLWEAQAWLDAGEPQHAAALLDNLPEAAVDQSVMVGDIMLARADAAARDHRSEAARALYRAYIERFPRGRRRFEAMAKLAKELASDDGESANRDAAELLEALLLESPLSDYGELAASLIAPVRKAANVDTSTSERRRFEDKVSLAGVEALLERRRYAETIKAANALLKTKRWDNDAKCRLNYAMGTARFKQRKRAAARPMFEQAAVACHRAKLSDLEVRAQYQAARGWYAAGDYKKAAQAFERLAIDHSKHSYVDDAWVLAAESWSAAKDEAHAQAALVKAIEADGDMKGEARRRRLLALFADDAPADVVVLCDAAIAESGGAALDRAKLHYYRGRALQRLGKLSDAVESWLAALRIAPLEYPGLLALSRLREAGDDAAQAGLEILRENLGSQPSEAVSVAPTKVTVLAQLGLASEVRDELRHEAIDGWPSVAILNQAGFYAHGQRVLANLGSKWRSTPPGPSNRHQWELAHPQPFSDIIADNEDALAVPSRLTFAVMQTESRFDPHAVSWAGARGLIQLMPGTAKSVARAADMKIKPEELFIPAINLGLGMRYLGGLVARYGGGDRAVALAVPSYNAGPGAVDRWLDERGTWDLDLFLESIPYDETRAYTQGVLGRWWAYRWIYSDSSSLDDVPFVPLVVPRRDDDDESRG